MSISFKRGQTALLCAVGLSAAFTASAATMKPRPYIIQLAEAPAASYRGSVAGLPATQVPEGGRLSARNPAVQAYVAHLDRQRGAVLQAAGVSPKVMHRYVYSFNGFSALLSDAQVKALSKLPQVVAISADEPRELTTNYTPHFLGLDEAGGIWSQTRKGSEIKGEDVIVGIVDGGFQPENASFADHVDASGAPTLIPGAGTLAYGPAPAKWTGSCTAGPAFEPARHCNNKVIGAQVFDATFKSTGLPYAWTEFQGSPRDVTGHGTHTSSTAAGNAKSQAIANTNDVGPISGIAPRARIAAYKVCWTWFNAAIGANQNNCWTGDSVAAIDKAVADGVDVINFSISGTTTNLLDPVEQAFLNATAAGVFVSASAGNSGPTASTVAHPSPWITTVANSTHDRFFRADANFGNGTIYNGASQSQGLPATPMILSTNAGLAGADPEQVRQCYVGTLDASKVTGRVVVCDRGTIARTDKSLAVKNAGGVGMVLVNAPLALIGGGSDTLNDDAHWIPTVHLPMANRDAVRTYAAAAGASSTMGVRALAPGVIAPVVAASSSRGPSLASNSLLKPDITAPGSSILAAFAMTQVDQAMHDAIIAGTSAMQPTAAYLDGTSMSSPHVAGSAALLKQKYPQWSPANIKSALMTSASTAVYLSNGALDPSFWNYGAGHLRPNGAADPGLVYANQPENYIRYLCGASLFPADDPDCAALGTLKSSDLNLPSINGDVVGATTFQRKLKNVGPSGSIYTASASLPGFTVSVNPPTLTLAHGQVGTVDVTITANGAAQGAWTQGALTWSDGAHVVRSPIVVRATNYSGTGALSSTRASDRLVGRYTYGFNGALGVEQSGMQEATRTGGTVGVATVADGNVACQTNAAGTTKLSFTAGPGTLVARFSLYDVDTSGFDGSTFDDLDLFVYGPTGALVGVSAGATANERVSLVLPAAGTYTACVLGFAPANGASSDFTMSSWTLQPGAGSLKLGDAPATVTAGQFLKLPMGWRDLTEGRRYMGAVRMVQGDLATGTTLGVTVLSADPGLAMASTGEISQRKAAAAAKR